MPKNHTAFTASYHLPLGLLLSASSLVLIASLVTKINLSTPDAQTFAAPDDNATPTCTTDVNHDGYTDLTDISYLISKLFTADTTADINQDGTVSTTDINLVIANLLDPCTPPATLTTTIFAPTSAFNQRIPPNATYTRDNLIGTVRHTYDEWSLPIYRITNPESIPLVTARVTSSGRTNQWPIPTYALPATESDHHLAVFDLKNHISYEFWDAHWTSASTISAGGMKDFALDGTGISNPTNQRVIAAGFSTAAGMIIREDFMTTSGSLDANQPLKHALTMALNAQIISPTGYEPPAVGAEESGRGSIPMGARYALPKNVDLNQYTLHPLSRTIAQALIDYGIIVNDGNSAPTYQGKHIGTIRLEPGLTNDLYGVSTENLINQVQSDIFNIISDHGLYRVTNN